MLKIYPAAILVSTAFIVLYLALASTGVLFYFENGEVIGTISGWCERVSGGVFREPANTVSNIGFIISGLLMLRVLSAENGLENVNKNTFTSLNPISVLYAIAVIFLGPGSWLMHGTHTAWGGWADNLSMIMYIIFPWLYNLKEMGQWSVNRFLKTYLLIVVVYSLARWFFGGRLGIGLDLFGLSIGLWIISEALFRFWSPAFRWLSGFVGFIVAAIFGIFPQEIFLNLNEYWWIVLFWVPAIFAKKSPRLCRTYSPWFFLGMASYLIAFVIWLQGYPDTPYCQPDSLLQPHAIWHLITACSTWCFFKFFRTERTILNKN
ncbi:MAG: hypothetical protein CMQ41_09485 [Gammaproteobacteria bacterium]|mgnify:CR=1 FL=1|nr:hypothetical protein [Gammaproteobacteria bacterium]|tara:strand:- start:1129 stop:2088 length:960 start_codon:yes stop_codon:yes gene_type:complete